ncbi:MAG: cation transporter [Nitrospinae bacterium]|nr:cation transporter [Nitrospinota bacterium]
MDQSRAYPQAVRAAKARKATVVGAVANLLLAGYKFAVGIMGNSAAMVADAAHSLTDLVTDVMVYVSVNIAAQEADEDHPYGHGRAETIAAAATGAALILAGLALTWDIIAGLVHGEVKTPTALALSGALISIVTKESLYRWTLYIGKQIDNQAVIANAWDHRGDALSSVAALIGIGGAMAGLPILDPLAAIVVVYMIIKVGVDITGTALRELMDTQPSPERLAELGGIIKSTSGVVDYHELKTRKMGADLYIDAHIQVRPDISVSEAHNIAETVRARLKANARAADALVHIDAEDDRQYQAVRRGREEVERRVRELARPMDGVRAITAVTLHYLAGRTFVELTAEFEDQVSIARAKELGEALKRAIERETDIAGVEINARLTDGGGAPGGGSAA